MGVSFAIPIEVALDVSRQLKSQGKVTRGRVGIGIQPMTTELARSFGLESPAGAIIVSLERGGPADKGGARIGDVVLDWNGEAIDEPNELPRRVAASAPGSLAHMGIWREGKHRTVELRVGEVRAEPGAVAREAPAKQEDARLGMAVRELTAGERSALGVDYGLLVVDVAQRAGPGSALLPGDVIVGVNQRHFGSRQEFERLLAAHPKGGMVALLVRRGDAALYVPLELG
jgi:serine protease Do